MSTSHSAAERPSKPQFVWLFILGISPYYLNDIYNPIIEGIPALYWALEILAWVVLPACILAYVFRRGLPASSLGMHDYIGSRPPNIATTLLSVVIIIAIVIGYRYADGVIKSHLPASQHHGYSGISDSAPTISLPPSPTTIPSTPSSVHKPLLAPHKEESAESAYSFKSDTAGSFSVKQDAPAQASSLPVILWLKALYLAFTAGIVEEIYFRGWLRRYWGKGALAVIGFVVSSTLLFSLIHWGQGYAQLAATACFGLMASIAYLGLRNLWPLIIAHVITDITYFWP